MIAIILFKLLMIQIAIQLTMTAVLEGRNSHYVSLLDPSVSDPSAQRITCPVYSIRLENAVNTFTKYIVQEAQFDLIADADWTEVPNIASFKLCASSASSDNKKMFMWDNDECRVTDKLFVRVSEPCNEETSTLVYMIEQPATSCEFDSLVLDHGFEETKDMCGGTTGMYIRCLNGKIYGYDSSTVYHDDGSGCIKMSNNGGNDFHNGQLSGCVGDLTCYPRTEADRAEYVQILTQMAGLLNAIAGSQFVAVDLKRLTSGEWQWTPSGVTQPENEGWASAPAPSGLGQDFGYVYQNGLISNILGGVADAKCCYKN